VEDLLSRVSVRLPSKALLGIERLIPFKVPSLIVTRASDLEFGIVTVAGFPLI
jgi:hypothetical protein